MSNSLEGQNPGAAPNQNQKQQPGWTGTNDNLVQFRIRPEHLAFFRRLADFLCQNGFIPELLDYDKQYGYPKAETVTYQRLYGRHLDILLFYEVHSVIRINISHNIEYFLVF